MDNSGKELRGRVAKLNAKSTEETAKEVGNIARLVAHTRINTYLECFPKMTAKELQCDGHFWEYLRSGDKRYLQIGR